MAKTARVFLSDVHLGTGQPYDWYQPARHRASLLAVLDYALANRSRIKDLVLLGDIFDTWLCPIDRPPHTIAEILDANPEVCDKLRRCVEELDNVFYINGNHDMCVTEEDLATLGSGARRIRRIPAYQAGMLYAEHGHRFAMFNAADRLHDPTHALPIGYFVTRVLCGHDDYDRPGAIVRSIDDLLESAFTTQTITSSVLEALMELTGRSDEDRVCMPFGRQDWTLGAVKRRYANVFDRWVEKFGHRYAIRSVLGELNALGWFADRLSTSRGYKVVVLGHSHQAKLDKDQWFVAEDRVYANAGYMCPSDGDDANFVEVDKGAGGLAVSLMRADATKVSIVKTQRL